MDACEVCGAEGLTGTQVCALIKRLSDMLELVNRNVEQQFSSPSSKAIGLGDIYKSNYLESSIRFLQRDIAEGTI